MWTVNVYVETDSRALKEMPRMAGYVLECVTTSGQTVTKEAFRELSGTWHASVLSALAEALSRINQSCEIHIFTRDTFILNMIEKNLPAWAKNDFRNRKGEPVKNHEEWRKVWEMAGNQTLVPVPGMHSYYEWMQAEMAKLKKPAATSIY